MKYVPKLENNSVNTKPRENTKDILILIGGVFGALAVGLVVFIWLLQLLLTSLSLEQERRWLGWMGRIQGEAVSHDHNVYLLFNQLTKAGFDNEEFELRVSCDTTANAFALPGGTIVLTKGLLKTVKSQAGLAFVLAHELGHMKNRDHMRGMSVQIALGFVSMLMGMSDSTLYSFAESLLKSAYSRQNEAEADDFSLQLMSKSLDNLNGADEFLDHASSKEGAAWEKYLAIARTHPVSKKRLEKVRSLMAQFPNPEGPILLDSQTLKCH